MTDPKPRRPNPRIPPALDGCPVPYRSRQVLDCVTIHLAKRQRFPTTLEVAEHVGCDRASVERAFEYLEREGYLARDADGHRAVLKLATGEPIRLAWVHVTG